MVLRTTTFVLKEFAESLCLGSYFNCKTRCQARHVATDELNRSRSVADRRQSANAVCPRRRPRAANALIAQATMRLGAALTPPASARAIPRPHFAFPGLSSSPQQQPSSRSSAVAIAVHKLAPSHSITTAALHRHPSNPLPPPVPADSIR